MLTGIWYWVIYVLVKTGLFLWHPISRVYGRENVPQSGKLIICSNHSGMADPFWVSVAVNYDHLPRIMAKKEALSYPVVGRILKAIRVIGVDRDAADVTAIKEALRALRDEQQLLIFPEGTRVQDRSQSQPKGGAVMLAAKSGAPILPVYISRRTAPFLPVKCIIGEPYVPAYKGRRTSEQQLDEAAKDLMDRIYALGETL